MKLVCGFYAFLWILAKNEWEQITLTEKELRKMNRYQLLELLILQTERADKLQQKVDELESQMNQQDLKMTALGSIAEASLQLGGVFKAAQEAADLYLDAAKKHAEEMEADARKKAKSIIEKAAAEARRMRGMED